MTHDSLATTQRAHISLIDCRHSQARSVPYRVRAFPTMPRRQKPARTLDSAKPYQRSHLACMPARLMTLAQRANSRFIYSANSLGVPPIGSAPSVASLLRISADREIRAT